MKSMYTIIVVGIVLFFIIKNKKEKDIISTEIATGNIKPASNVTTYELVSPFGIKPVK